MSQPRLTKSLSDLINRSMTLRTAGITFPRTVDWQQKLTPEVMKVLGDFARQNKEAEAVFEAVLKPSLHHQLFKFPQPISIMRPTQQTLKPYPLKVSTDSQLTIDIVDFFGGFGAITSLVEPTAPGLPNQHFAAVIANFAGMCCVVADLLSRTHGQTAVQITWEPHTKNYAIGTVPFAIGSTIPGPNGHFKNACREAHVRDFHKIFPEVGDDPHILEPIYLERRTGQRLGHCAELMAWLRMHREIRRGATLLTMALKIEALRADDPQTKLPFYYGIPKCKSDIELLTLLTRSGAFEPRCLNCSSLGTELARIFGGKFNDKSPQQILREEYNVVI
ncbi:hypothetical protein C8R46DRAFT_1228973 [Mycena filopes]|nr:hypothetical protein C8R46DRAFT_1228973 [Mycena filopes]